MKNKLFKLFFWIKDRFSFLFVVLLRLYIGRKKKENPSEGSNPSSEEAKTEKGKYE